MGRSKTRFRAVCRVCCSSERQAPLNSMGPSFSTNLLEAWLDKNWGGMSSGVVQLDSASMSKGHKRQLKGARRHQGGRSRLLIRGKLPLGVRRTSGRRSARGKLSKLSKRTTITTTAIPGS